MKLTPEVKAHIAKTAVEFGVGLADEMEDRPLELLGNWDYAGACEDSFPGTITDKQYQDAIKQAKAACVAELKKRWGV